MHIINRCGQMPQLLGVRIGRMLCVVEKGRGSDLHPGKKSDFIVQDVTEKPTISSPPAQLGLVPICGGTLTEDTGQNLNHSTRSRLSVGSEMTLSVSCGFTYRWVFNFVRAKE